MTPTESRSHTIGDHARWGALSQRLLGRLASVEWQLNLIVALATGRDTGAVLRALQMVERLSVEDRTRLLDDLETPIDGLSQTTAEWLRDLVRVRNQLAHSWIVMASHDEVTFRSFFRGRHREFTITQDVMAGHMRKSAFVARNLLWLETLVGDPRVWGELMGFDARD